MISFGWILGLGAALGLQRVYRQRSGQWVDVALLVLLTSLLGARLGYAAEHLAYFRQHPAEILLFNLGGLSGWGAVLGWLGGLLLAAGLQRVSPLRLADWLYPLIPPLTVSAYLALWQAGALYGPLAGAGDWWAVPAADESGQVALRWPLQLGAALALLVFYWLLEQLVTLPRPAGWLASLAGAWLLAVNLVVALLRADPVPGVGRMDIPVDVLGNLVLLGLFLGVFSALTLLDRRKVKMGYHLKE